MAPTCPLHRFALTKIEALALAAWRNHGTWQIIHEVLYEQVCHK
jgi:hypothetical protein